jgi:transcriptional regulator with XRE-family HTH domain
MRLRPDIPPEPVSALPSLRRRADLTVTELAALLDVRNVTVSGWEHGASDPPARVLRELSLILGCGVNEILNGRVHPSRLKAWLERWEADPPPEVSAQLSFRGGVVHEVPLCESECEELFSAVRSRERVPWVGIDTADRRLLFFNTAELESIIVDAITKQPARVDEGAVVKTARGDHIVLHLSDALYDAVELLLRVAEDAGSVLDTAHMNDWFLRLEAGEGGSSRDYRLGALRLIEAPLEPYRTAAKKVMAEREEALKAARAAVEVKLREKGRGKGHRLIAGRPRPRFAPQDPV